MMPDSSWKKFKSGRIFEIVYKGGKTLYSNDKSIKVRYFIEDRIVTPELKIAVSVSSKAGGAVWRNRVRRLVYESIRTEKKQLEEFVSSENRCLLIVLSLNRLNQKENKRINIAEIKPAILELLGNLKNRINELQI